jgi:hypothetical protein
MSTKPGRQSTEGYAHGSRLLVDMCASHERDGNAERHVVYPGLGCCVGIIPYVLLCFVIAISNNVLQARLP